MSLNKRKKIMIKIIFQGKKKLVKQRITNHSKQQNPCRGDFGGSITDDTLNDGKILQPSTFYGGNDVIAKLKIARKKAAIPPLCV